MSIKTFLFICCAAVMVSTANAENPVKPETPETPNHPTHKLMDKRVSELMADRVGFKKDMALKELAEINEKAELDNRLFYFCLAYGLYDKGHFKVWSSP